MRASDADRERVAQVLRESAGDGRLDMDELSERLDAAYAARTFGELRTVTRDLPVVAPSPAPSTSNGGAHWYPRARMRKFAWVAVLLIAIWAFTGAGYFWPVWPLLWFAFATMRSRHRFRPV